MTEAEYGPLRARGKEYIDQVRKDVDGMAKKVLHRVRYGSPPLMVESEDLAISPIAALAAKQARIRRRRILFGLPFEEWTEPS